MDESTRTWRDRGARWHKSGHSARVFAEQEGVSPGTLYSWSRRLGMKRSEYRQRSDAAKLPSFLPVVVASTEATAPSSGAPLEIVLPDGAVVRVPPSFDEVTLARVIRALGGRDDPWPRLDLRCHRAARLAPLARWSRCRRARGAATGPALRSADDDLEEAPL
ncbi:IS66 family insertion sequence element accessory protein TnpA [Sorangium sp. So ce1014]|uniref:IS66 family insertion sequence element accessory protein TnpA n=1 Tax=Sorangium sp. So ce1014 TaxID=3133326 RepID=UPI003F6016D0